jgi:hypothetical protein
MRLLVQQRLPTQSGYYFGGCVQPVACAIATTKDKAINQAVQQKENEHAQDALTLQAKVLMWEW